MLVKEFVIPYRRSDEFYIYPIGDIHLGTIHCAETEAREKVKEIKDTPNAFWVGMGDYSECITPGDKRWEPSLTTIPDWLHQDNFERDLRKRVVELFEPIKDRCIGLLYGNHEDSFRIHNHANIHKNICEDLGVDSLGYSAFIHLRYKRRNSNESHVIKLAVTHGTGGARTPGGKLNYLKRYMDDFEAQLYAYAHVHDIHIYSPNSLGTTEGLMIKAKGKVGALTGCFFRTYTQGEIASYGEKKVYGPTRIGCPRFYINPNKGELGVEVPTVIA